MARNVKTYKFKGQMDKNGKRAIFTRIPALLYSRIEAEAKAQKRSMSQHAAFILEEHAKQSKEQAA